MVVSTYASSSQGFNQAFNTSSLCPIASTCSLISFTSYSFANLCVMATVHVIALTSSYLCCNSRASISSLCTLRSSCRLVKTSSDYSKSAMKSFIVALTATTKSLTTTSYCSLISSEVEGWVFNLQVLQS